MENSKLKEVLDSYKEKGVLSYTYYPDIEEINCFMRSPYGEHYFEPICIISMKEIYSDADLEKRCIDNLIRIVEANIKQFVDSEIARILLVSENIDLYERIPPMSLNDIAKKEQDDPQKAIAHWKAVFANNGWIDWFCPHCGTLVANEDVHINLDWKYCPYCGKKVGIHD